MAGMIRISLSKKARLLRRETFWRCGVQHSAEGAEFAPDAFTAAEWARLRADPMLDVAETGAAAVEASGAGSEDARTEAERIAAAVAALATPDDFTSGGVPKVDALQAAVTAQGLDITIDAAKRDEIWKELGGS